jgi:hypothetical protein
MPKLEPPLMRKKRRALHEKHRERRHPDVAHSIGRIDPATLVRKAIQASSQRTEEGFKGPRIPFLLVESNRRTPAALPRRHSCNYDSFALRTAGHG